MKLCKTVRGASVKPVKNVDDGIRRRGTNASGFSKIGDKERLQPDLANASATGSMPQP